MNRPDRPSAASRAHIERVRAMAMALPEATERISHGEPAWFVRRSPQFAMFADHHHDQRIGLWAAAPDGAQQVWLRSDPEVFYIPSYVGSRGWVGVYLDTGVDDDRLETVIVDAYRAVAPAALLARLDQQST